MATNQSGAGPAPERATITMDAELVVQLVGALEKIGTAFTIDELNDARTLSLVDRLAGRGNGGPAAGIPDPVRARAALDYAEIRGLLGRADAATPLRMRRTRTGDVEFVDPVPVSAAVVAVESPGDAASGPITEHFDKIKGLSKPTLDLSFITAQMPIARVEAFAEDGTLVAFGPSFPPVH
jgi:hypothetical protein